MKSITFCYGHRLLDYDGKCANIHGHNGRAEIILAAEQLDNRGILVDFSDIHSIAKNWIDENLDHKLLLRHDDPLISALDELKENYFVMQENPTAENIAALLFKQIQATSLPVIRVKLWETDTCYADYTNN